MVGVGMLMLAVSWFSAWRLKKQGEPGTWPARALMVMSFSGWVATVAGWYVTEIGRQPYLVYGVLKTADAASAVPSGMIATTFAMYLLLYVTLTIAYVSVVFYMARKAQFPKVIAPSQEAPLVGSTPVPTIAPTRGGGGGVGSRGGFQPAHK